MNPTTICLFSLAIAGLSSAQSSTISLFIPDADPQPLVASVAGSDAAATTYAIQCSPGTDSSDCGFDGVVLLTEGPSTAAYTISEVASNGTVLFTGYIECSVMGTTSAICVESFGGVEANFPGVSTETFAATDITYIPVVITANAVASGSGSSSSAGASTTTAAPTASKTSGISGTTTTNSNAASQTSSSKAQTSTAGVPALTRNTGWALGGAAVALALLG